MVTDVAVSDDVVIDAPLIPVCTHVEYGIIIRSVSKEILTKETLHKVYQGS